MPVAAATSASVDDCHGVPLGEHLFVPRRLDPLGASLGQETPGLFDLGWTGQRRPDRPHRDAAAFPVPEFRDAVPVGSGAHEVHRQQCAELVEGERGVGSLDAAGVGVEGRIQRAVGSREVAQDEVERLGDHAEIVVAPAVLPRVQVGPGQQGLVGQHLLEVRHQPVRVGGVSAEPSDQMVVDAAGRHGVERARGHGAGLLARGATAPSDAQAEVDQGRPGELGRGPEAAPLGVEAGGPGWPRRGR